MDQLKTALSIGGILAPEHIEEMSSHFETRELKAEENFTEYGHTSRELGFLNSGILRMYMFGNHGEEVTKYFIRPNMFFADLESYYSQQPGEIGIQAVIPSQVIFIRKQIWDRLMEQNPKLFIVTKYLSETALLNKLKDNDFLSFGTAKEKYLEFLKRYPDLALQVPLQYIASYLKITPQSLSRIRKELTRH